MKSSFFCNEKLKKNSFLCFKFHSGYGFLKINVGKARFFLLRKIKKNSCPCFKFHSGDDSVKIKFPRLRRAEKVHETGPSNLEIIVSFRLPGTISVRMGFSLEPNVFINSKIKKK